MNTSTNESPFMTIQELAIFICIAVGTLYNWRSAGIGPQSVRIGGRVRYRRTDVLEWLAAQESGEAHVA